MEIAHCTRRAMWKPYRSSRLALLRSLRCFAPSKHSILDRSYLKLAGTRTGKMLNCSQDHGSRRPTRTEDLRVPYAPYSSTGRSTWVERAAASALQDFEVWTRALSHIVNVPQQGPDAACHSSLRLVMVAADAVHFCETLAVSTQLSAAR